ncbi:MAG: hypothetical protein JWO56_2453 [Acidobacteria bacterium]|nr:hypothetical protein [Acidobacteriota bacterium]
MKRIVLITLLAVAAALPLQAASGKAQSYFTFDDGGTMVRQGDDGREVEARINFPVFPGDEITTNRRGRSEIRLSDGNVLGLDRATTLRFRSINDSYEGDAGGTIAELRIGHVVVQRTNDSAESLRLDTDYASYIATDESIYAVESDGRARDRVTVFDGSVEVRTPKSSVRLRTGEEAHVDLQGVYGSVQQARSTTDDFERWFLRRSERNSSKSSRYLDRSLGYAGDDLDANGSWIYVSSYGGWCWRPRVEVGWRPYYHGSWAWGRGALTWVSYEPWGWVPYHYGRWAYDPGYGWVWLPGSGYAPAWVYWMYGPNYLGWAPMGWYDCYRPYYNWAYQPNVRSTIGFGFYGRVNVVDIDLRPWTFVDANTVINTRVDHASLTADIIRSRLARDAGGFATVSSSPARFTRPELKDPAAAVNTIARRGIGSGTGKEGSGSPTDMTPFFRRDPELSTAVRDRVSRTLPSDNGSRNVLGGIGGSYTTGGGSSSPSGAEGRIGRGSNDGSVGGSINRGEVPAAGATTGAATGATTGATVDRSLGSGGWRDRVDRSGARDTTPAMPSVDRTPVDRGNIGRGIDRGTDRGSVDRTPVTPRDDAAWRGRAAGRTGGGDGASAPSAAPATPRADVPRDVPRRVIDRIGGARVVPGDGGSSSGDSSSRRGGYSSGSGSSSSGRSGGSSSGSSSGGSSNSGGGSSRPSYSPPPQPSSPPPAPAPRSNDGGGHVQRNKE